MFLDVTHCEGNLESALRDERLRMREAGHVPKIRCSTLGRWTALPCLACRLCPTDAHHVLRDTSKIYLHSKLCLHSKLYLHMEGRLGSLMAPAVACTSQGQVKFTSAYQGPIWCA